MNGGLFIRSLATLLVIAIVTPTAFLAVPQRTHAQASIVSCVGNLLGLAGLFPSLSSILPGMGGGIVDVLSGVPVRDSTVGGFTSSTAGSSAGNCLNEVILKPMARSMIRMLLQSITMYAINWINGRNGTGQPSFVQNLTRHLQALGDAVALPFINQARMLLNPAFAASIATSLLFNYARQTSVGGFFLGNPSVLASVSSNPGAFANGDWSKGGTSAWFALTTNPGDNPYMLYPAAAGQLNSLVDQAQSNRKQDLSQSGGFLSWCGDGASYKTSAGINPRASCMDQATGTQLPVKTPGSVIRDYTQQALGSDMAQLVNPTDINQALFTVIQAAIQRGITSIYSVLGVDGLFGTSQTSSARPQAITTQLQTSATTALTNSGSTNTVVQTKLAQVSDYTTAWNTITDAATAALNSVTSLKNACATQASAADAALSTINSVLAQGQAALSSVSATQTFALQVQQEVTSNASTLVADTATLQAMSPSATDVTSAQAESRPGGTSLVTSDPGNLLSVSGGSTVDRMNLLAGNAQALATTCAVPDTGGGF